MIYPIEKEPEIRAFFAVAVLRDPSIYPVAKLKFSEGQKNWIRMFYQARGACPELATVMRYIKEEEDKVASPQSKDALARMYAKALFAQEERTVSAAERGVELIKCPTCPWSFLSLANHRCKFR